MPILNKTILLSLVLGLMASMTLTASAQDDVMDDGGYYEQPSQGAEPGYDTPAEPRYDGELPVPADEEYIPPSDDAGEYENPPSTPSEAIKDFNHSQDERLDQLDSYEEDY